MPSDLKIGMALGLVVIIAAALWLATRPRLSTAMLDHRGRDVNVSPGADAGAMESGGARAGLPSESDDNDVRPVETVDGSAREPVVVVDSAVYEQTEKIKTQRFHIVRKGETLSDISYNYYGSSKQWQRIARANPNVVKDANKIKAGTKLIIPD